MGLLCVGDHKLILALCHRYKRPYLFNGRSLLLFGPIVRSLRCPVGSASEGLRGAGVHAGMEGLRENVRIRGAELDQDGACYALAAHRHQMSCAYAIIFPRLETVERRRMVTCFLLRGRRFMLCSL